MRGTGKARPLLCALCALAMALTGALAHATEPPTAGGEVPSTLALSLGKPSPFTRAGPDLFTSTLRVEVTATEAPARLGLTEGEAETPLASWRHPVTSAPVGVRLRRSATARDSRKLFLVTLTAGGP